MSNQLNANVVHWMEHVGEEQYLAGK